MIILSVVNRRWIRCHHVLALVVLLFCFSFQLIINNHTYTKTNSYFVAAVRPNQYGTIKDLGEDDTVISSTTVTKTKTAEEYLHLGSTALSEDQNAKAIELYEQGLSSVVLVSQTTTTTPTVSTPTSFIVRLSLETNLATAYLSIGDEAKAIQHYEEAIAIYTVKHQKIDASNIELIEKATSIISEASFFYGMVLQGNIIDDDDNDNDTENGSTAQEAIDAFEFAVQLDPNLGAAYVNLGSVYQDHLKNYEQALHSYNKACEVLTTGGDTTNNNFHYLSQLQYRIGVCLQHDDDTDKGDNNNNTPVSCQEMVNYALSRAIHDDPDNSEAAKHMLAANTADATMTHATNKYIKELFDQYATNFEHSLVEDLGYDGYAQLRRGFDRAMLLGGGDGRTSVPTTTTIFSKVVDAGCGTGLVGEQFRNISSHLIGVDLSQAILDESKKLRPNLYNELIVGDIIEVFREKQPISLIVAADSFIYSGDLDPLFASISVGLRDDDDNTNDNNNNDDDEVSSGGYIAFTLENVEAETEAILDESKPDWRWQLMASGRFAHRKEYVTNVGQAHNLALIHYERLDGFRLDNGKDVPGHLFVMQKRGSIPQNNSNNSIKDEF